MIGSLNTMSYLPIKNVGFLSRWFFNKFIKCQNESFINQLSRYNFLDLEIYFDWTTNKIEFCNGRFLFDFASTVNSKDGLYTRNSYVFHVLDKINELPYTYKGARITINEHTPAEISMYVSLFNEIHERYPNLWFIIDPYYVNNSSMKNHGKLLIPEKSYDHRPDKLVWNLRKWYQMHRLDESMIDQSFYYDEDEGDPYSVKFEGFIEPEL